MLFSSITKNEKYESLKRNKFFSFFCNKTDIILLLFFGWLLSRGQNATTGEPIGLTLWLLLLVVVYVVIVLPLLLVRWLAWGKKRYLKSVKAHVYPYLMRAQELQEILNTTTDPEEFESGFEEIQTVLLEMIKYEKDKIYSVALPSTDYRRLLENEWKTRELLKKRILIAQNDYDHMDGHVFESFCASLLERNGFSDVTVTPGSGDQGIDILAQKDNIRYGIQCKCYTSDVGNDAVQQAYSGISYYNCNIAVVMTNRYFTKSAKELAERTNVFLWDRDTLDDFIVSAK